ncbi:tenascin-N [Cuculus canorus]|uniref:tenascin-N n=1 Tax=Cuculus canorus TaxID=55661 RepID=UPI0023AAE9B3|nr:tenascin-N [Cuculus canorus]XP_053929761.1 tenascin-N [Cuculus canorus]
MDLQSWLAFPVGVLLCCALQTSAVQQPASHNCTSNSQRISFSHSYKIDLPTSSQIKVEADPLQHEDDNEVPLDPGDAEENEEQNIIFRHNIHVHAPKGECEALTHIKGLLERVEKLEKEVAELKEVCSPQKCCGGSQGVSHCSGHGTFLYDSCSCRCAEGWEGSDCSRPACPGHCSGRGRCDSGTCVCHEPYFGEDCSQQLCPENCSGNGICDTAGGLCRCYEEFIGEDCSEKRCPGDCSGNGFCDTGECYCHDGFFGLDCSQVLAPQNLQLLNSTENSLAVSWDQMIDVDNYLISYYPLGYETMAKRVPVSKEQLSYEMVGLRPSTLYNVTLYHVKKGIASEPKYLEASTVLSALNAIWVTEEMEHSLEVEWENPPTDVDYYKLKFRSLVEMDEKQVIVPKSNDPKSRHFVTGLKPGTEYEVTVIPVKDNAEGKPSSVTGRTGLDSPTNVTTDRVTEDTATVSWHKVEAPIDRYVVRYTSAEGSVEEIAVGSENDTVTLLHLKPGIEYAIHLWAEKGPQRSKKASARAVTEIDPPKNLRVSDVTHSTGVATWTPPAAQIDGYALTCRGDDGTYKEVQLGPSEQRFVLEGLERGVRYTIFLMAYKGDHQSRKTDSTFSTVGFLYPYPADCSQMQQNGNASSGVYTIYLNGDGSQPTRVYCDMATDGGGWIVFQRRSTGEVDFYKRWKSYVEGFGDPAGEFWLGLDKLHNLTSSSHIRYELRVDLRTASESVYAVYDFFQVASSRDRYRLSVGNYRGNAGDAMTYHNGWKFTTWDRDNDVALSNCALTHRGAWWYKNCHLANLNGKYGETKHSEGVNWEPWKGHEFSIPFTEMKIRPQSSSNEPVLGRKKRDGAIPRPRMGLGKLGLWSMLQNQDGIYGLFMTYYCQVIK